MAPGEVGSHQHHQIGQFQIFVLAGHGISAEGAAVACDAGGHAQARVGVDIGAADIALHQFVGDVVIFGQQLTRDVKRHRIRTMRGDGCRKPGGNQIQRAVPGGRRAVNARGDQAARCGQGFTQCRPLDAKPAPVGRVIGVALDLHPALVVGRGDHAATDTAIGAGGADGRAHALHGWAALGRAALGWAAGSALRRTRPFTLRTA